MSGEGEAERTGEAVTRQIAPNRPDGSSRPTAAAKGGARIGWLLYRAIRAPVVSVTSGWQTGGGARGRRRVLEGKLEGSAAPTPRVIVTGRSLHEKTVHHVRHSGHRPGGALGTPALAEIAHPALEGNLPALDSDPDARGVEFGIAQERLPDAV